MQKADPQQLAKFIHNEHPQTIALILSHLNASQAAGLLISLPAELRADVALRMASLDQISPEIISKIAAIIGAKAESLGELSRESYGGVRAVSEMFNRLDSGTSKEILEVIEQNDPKLVETIRHLMFVFEDLLLLSQDGVKEVLAKVDRKILTVALKGTSEQLKTHILQVMSQRGAEMLQGRHGRAGSDQDQRSGSGAAADHRGGPATGSRRRHQPEGHGGRTVCRLKLHRGGISTDPIAWRRVASMDVVPPTGKRIPPAGLWPAAARWTAAPLGDWAVGLSAGFPGRPSCREARSIGTDRSDEPPIGSHHRRINRTAAALPARSRGGRGGAGFGIARRILHRELTVEPEALLGLVKAALEKIERGKCIACACSREDAPMVKQHLEKIGTAPAVEVIARSQPAHAERRFSIQRGGTLDASVETQLAEIERGFADLVRQSLMKLDSLLRQAGTHRDLPLDGRGHRAGGPAGRVERPGGGDRRFLRNQHAGRAHRFARK